MTVVIKATLVTSVAAPTALVIGSVAVALAVNDGRDPSGQWLGMPASVGSDGLCLDLKADPLGRLLETDETDNATSVAIQVDGTRVRRCARPPVADRELR